jgi:hypothetical protein
MCERRGSLAPLQKFSATLGACRQMGCERARFRRIKRIQCVSGQHLFVIFVRDKNSFKSFLKSV